MLSSEGSGEPEETGRKRRKPGLLAIVRPTLQPTLQWAIFALLFMTAVIAVAFHRSPSSTRQEDSAGQSGGSAAVRAAADYPESDQPLGDNGLHDIPVSNSGLEARIEARLESMSVDERIAQLLLLGWHGEEPDELIMRWIRERGIGGIKVFGRNANDIETLTRTISAMQSAAVPDHPALFTATDQEGGAVRHVRGTTSRSAGNMALGATALPADAYDTGRLIGEEMRRIGINLNFAPTVDVYRHSEADVIGSRAFGDDPYRAAILGLAFYRGQESEGVISTAKHYPGHGNARGDSHIMLPELSETFDELLKNDLLPYKLLIEEKIPAILSAHLSFPQITGEDTPASLSRKIMSDLLRENLGFEGILVTDDMHMLGATLYADQRGWSFGELLVRAIEAGNDIIMLSDTPAFDGEVWNTLRSAWDERPGFRERVNESVLRILRVKEKYVDGTRLSHDLQQQAASRIPTDEASEFFADHAKRAVSWIGEADTETVRARLEGATQVLIAGNVLNFIREARLRFPGAEVIHFPYTPTHRSREQDRSAVQSAAATADAIIFGLSNRNSLEVLQELQPWADRIVVVSTLSPLLIEEADFVESGIAVYGFERPGFRAGFEVLSGEREAQGIAPLAPIRTWGTRGDQEQ